VLRAQWLLSPSVQSSPATCQSDSVGMFLTRAKRKVVNTMGNIVTFLGTVDDVLPFVNDTISDLGTIKTELNK
jgi:hypothetical protein